jgi:DNA-binding Lrp family transcriptional regulator
MVAAVLIRCEPQREQEVLDAVRKLDGLFYVYLLFGRYDMVALVRAVDLGSASDVVGRIRAVSGVLSTETLVMRPTP